MLLILQRNFAVDCWQQFRIVYNHTLNDSCNVSVSISITIICAHLLIFLSNLYRDFANITIYILGLYKESLLLITSRSPSEVRRNISIAQTKILDDLLDLSAIHSYLYTANERNQSADWNTPPTHTHTHTHIYVYIYRQYHIILNRQTLTTIIYMYAFGGLNIVAVILFMIRTHIIVQWHHMNGVASQITSHSTVCLTT